MGMESFVDRGHLDIDDLVRVFANTLHVSKVGLLHSSNCVYDVIYLMTDVRCLDVYGNSSQMQNIRFIEIAVLSNIFRTTHFNLRHDGISFCKFDFNTLVSVGGVRCGDDEITFLNTNKMQTCACLYGCNDNLNITVNDSSQLAVPLTMTITVNDTSQPALSLPVLTGNVLLVVADTYAFVCTNTSPKVSEQHRHCNFNFGSIFSCTNKLKVAIHCGDDSSEGRSCIVQSNTISDEYDGDVFSMNNDFIFETQLDDTSRKSNILASNYFVSYSINATVGCTCHVVDICIIFTINATGNCVQGLDNLTSWKFDMRNNATK